MILTSVKLRTSEARAQKHEIPIGRSEIKSGCVSL